MQDYSHILQGLPVMYLIEVIAMFAVLIQAQRHGTSVLPFNSVISPILHES